VRSMQKIVQFTDLNAWKEGHKLVLVVYKVTRFFPEFEQFILVSQMLRAVVSVTSNIAEGFSRKSAKEKIQFYFTAKGSLTEVCNQLIIARDVGYISKDEFESIWKQTEVVGRLLTGLIRSIR
jgi:four helix bundle protein